MGFNHGLHFSGGEPFLNFELLCRATGLAPYRVESTGLFPARPAAAFLAEPCSPELIRRWHNHFYNYNNTMPGYCGGITLGDCRHLALSGDFPELSPREFYLRLEEGVAGTPENSG